jgi:translation initiation factor IF-2
MSEVNTPRLMAAAKEFNIGTNTLIDFLVSKNFKADDLKPSTKLSEEMYRVLQAEFQQDKVAKEKAEQLSEKAEVTISELIETVKEKSAPIIAKAEEFAEEAKEKISVTIETAKEKINSFSNDGSHDAKEPEATSTNSVEEYAD